jgi:hypothetical protein
MQPARVASRYTSQRQPLDPTPPARPVELMPWYPARISLECLSRFNRTDSPTARGRGQE